MIDGPAGHFRAGAGEPLVLLHGLGMSWRAWEPVLAALQRHHDVLAPTLPGHRGAAPAPEAPTISALVDILEAELDNAAMTAPHVVGNSLGGWLALELARRGRARSVTAFSPAGAWRSSRDLLRLQLGLRLSNGVYRNPLMSLYILHPLARRAALLGMMERADRMTRRQAADLLLDIRACTLLPESVRMGTREGQLAAFAAGHCPIQIAWGRRDRVIGHRRHGVPLLERLPCAEQVMLPGVGHTPMYDDPERVTSLILGLTARVDGRSGNSSTRQGD